MNGRWCGGHQVWILWLDGPPVTAVQTAVGEIADAALMFERRTVNFDERSNNH